MKHIQELNDEQIKWINKKAEGSYFCIRNNIDDFDINDHELKYKVSPYAYFDLCEIADLLYLNKHLKFPELIEEMLESVSPQDFESLYHYSRLIKIREMGFSDGDAHQIIYGDAEGPRFIPLIDKMIESLAAGTSSVNELCKTVDQILNNDSSDPEQEAIDTINKQMDSQ